MGVVRQSGTHQISDASLYHHEIWKSLEIDWKAMIAAWNSAYICVPPLASLSLLLLQIVIFLEYYLWHFWTLNTEIMKMSDP